MILLDEQKVLEAVDKLRKNIQVKKKDEQGNLRKYGT